MTGWIGGAAKERTAIWQSSLYSQFTFLPGQSFLVIAENVNHQTYAQTKGMFKKIYRIFCVSLRFQFLHFRKLLVFFR